MVTECTCGEDSDCWCYIDLKNNVQAGLKTLGFEPCNTPEEDALHSYGGTVIAEKEYHTINGNSYKRLDIIIRGGYYSGMNIDYTIVDTREDEDAISDSIGYMETLMARDLRKMKKVVAQYTEELLKVGQFSNGEAVYKKK